MYLSHTPCPPKLLPIILFFFWAPQLLSVHPTTLPTLARWISLLFFFSRPKMLRTSRGNGSAKPPSHLNRRQLLVPVMFPLYYPLHLNKYSFKAINIQTIFHILVKMNRTNILTHRTIGPPTSPV
ncbi:hypothetical protein GGI35DRAFT_462491 [Trichoderma velutinum]